MRAKSVRNSTPSQKQSVMGYSVVIVNVKPTQVTGIDVFDGKTYTVTVDSNGNLVRTLVE